MGKDAQRIAHRKAAGCWIDGSAQHMRIQPILAVYRQLFGYGPFAFAVFETVDAGVESGVIGIVSRIAHNQGTGHQYERTFLVAFENLCGAGLADYLRLALAYI
ncbi:hypothetical protein D9M72_336010 [compost metagenome]